MSYSRFKFWFLTDTFADEPLAPMGRDEDRERLSLEEDLLHMTVPPPPLITCNKRIFDNFLYRQHNLQAGCVTDFWGSQLMGA